MKQIRKGLACLMSFALALTLSGAALVSADPGTSGRKQRTEGLDLSGQEEALSNPEEGWSWTPDGEGGYILVLDNADISAASGDALSLPSNTDVEIILKGNSRLKGSSALFAVNNSAGGVVIREEGEGSLEAVSEETSGWGTISVSNLTIESGTVAANGGGNCIDSLTMTGGVLSIDCYANNGWAPLHTIGRVSITGGLLEITDSSESSTSGAIYNYPSDEAKECGIFIGGNAEVNIRESVHGICVLDSSLQGKVHITGGSVAVKTDGYGILAQKGDILLNGGTISVDTAGKTAISASNGKADFTGADVKISRTAFEDEKGVVAGEITGSWEELHHPAEQWTCDGQYHWKVCLDPGCAEQIDRAAHSGGTASCISQAACDACGQLYGTSDPSRHVHVEHIEAQEASAGKPGNIEYWHCGDCGAYFSDAGLSNPIDREETVIPALEETTEAETEETTAAEESTEGTETSEETAEPEETLESVSEAESEKMTEESSSEAAEENAPGTGDKTSFVFFAMLLVLSGGIAAGALQIRKRAK